MQAISLVWQHTRDTIDHKKLAWILAGLFAMLMFFYGYFLNSAVAQVIARENTLRESGVVSSDVHELEFQYITAQSVLGLSQAHSLGFVESTETLYIVRKSPETLTLNTRIRE